MPGIWETPAPFRAAVDPAFDDLLRRHYPHPVAFEVTRRRARSPGSERSRSHQGSAAGRRR
jgi:hypothetical protein